MRSLAAGFAAIAVVLAGVWFVSARTADSGCAEAAERQGATSITVSWSWAPPGTTCTFDGRSETRLFW